MASSKLPGLLAGKSLNVGGKLASVNNSFYMIMQSDGNLVIYNTNNQPLWATSTNGRVEQGRLDMQSDGNLVLYDRNNTAKWTTGTHTSRDAKWGTPAFKPVRASVSNNGALELYNANGDVVWSSLNFKGEKLYAENEPAPAAPSAPQVKCDAKDAVTKYKKVMMPGNQLFEMEKLVSANGKFQFRVTKDGEFVIEEILDNASCKVNVVYTFPLASPDFSPSNTSNFSLNSDCNICMHSKQNKVYCATNGVDEVAPKIIYKCNRIELTDDGRLVLINGEGNEIWSTPKK